MYSVVGIVGTRHNIWPYDDSLRSCLRAARAKTKIEDAALGPLGARSRLHARPRLQATGDRLTNRSQAKEEPTLESGSLPTTPTYSTYW